VQKVAQESEEQSSQDAGPHNPMAVSCGPTGTRFSLFWIAQHELSSQDSHFQLNDKSVTDMLILHAEASFISAERGLRRGILSRTSLKHHISELMIFICKQLKRPVAFSMLHLGSLNATRSLMMSWSKCRESVLCFDIAFMSSLC